MKCPNFTDLYVAFKLSQHHLLKRLSFLHCIFLPSLLKIDCRCEFISGVCFKNCSYEWNHTAFVFLSDLFHYAKYPQGPSMVSHTKRFHLLFWLCPAACGILVLWPGIELGSAAVRAHCPNHWTAREFPDFIFFRAE